MDMKLYWHSTAHILAAAVKKLFPEAKLGIGPAIENGFYYDFFRKEPFLPKDLKLIEGKMSELIKENLEFERIEKTKNEAVSLLKKLDEPFKIELMNAIPEEKISFYRNGDFIDLCRGPHLSSTGEVKAFSLLSIAAAYWKGDEKRESFQRIYGISFPTKKELDDYLELIEEAKNRDHRKLGKELDLFSIHPEVGSGLIYWHPQGALIRKIIEDFLEDEHLKRGYGLVYTPHLGNLNQWKTSGHWDFYRELMYPPLEVEKDEFMLRPMNCPGHILIYKNQLRSYRDLPIRWSELGTVYRLEKSGVLHGLLRVRGFTQDDAHIFCQPDQLKDEIFSVLEFAIFLLKSFGFDQYEVLLSTRPEKYVGTMENWEKATSSLKESLEKIG
ncbi:MAG: threonine--tRNA ligase, partial [bacterium (Candidatus Ratteibacteria) CG15_BIG_FIL_POST_REV_8_21_14_020_41_12]